MTRLLLLCLAIGVTGCASPSSHSGTITFCPPDCPAGSGGDDMSAVARSDGGGGSGGSGGRHDMNEVPEAGTAMDLSQNGPSPDLLMPPDMTSTCAHPICTKGAKLTSTCDPCVAQICSTDSYCCNTGWSSVCVAEVTSICGQTCP